MLSLHLEYGAMMLVILEASATTVPIFSGPCRTPILDPITPCGVDHRSLGWIYLSDMPRDLGS